MLWKLVVFFFFKSCDSVGFEDVSSNGYILRQRDKLKEAINTILDENVAIVFPAHSKSVRRRVTGLHITSFHMPGATTPLSTPVEFSSQLVAEVFIPSDLSAISRRLDHIF